MVVIFFLVTKKENDKLRRELERSRDKQETLNNKLLETQEELALKSDLNLSSSVNFFFQRKRSVENSALSSGVAQDLLKKVISLEQMNENLKYEKERILEES